MALTKSTQDKEAKIAIIWHSDEEIYLLPSFSSEGLFLSRSVIPSPIPTYQFSPFLSFLELFAP